MPHLNPTLNGDIRSPDDGTRDLESDSKPHRNIDQYFIQTPCEPLQLCIVAPLQLLSFPCFPLTHRLVSVVWVIYSIPRADILPVLTYGFATSLLNLSRTWYYDATGVQYLDWLLFTPAELLWYHTIVNVPSSLLET